MNRALVGILSIAVAIVCLAAAGSAVAATPWWQLDSLSVPANLPPGGTGKLIVSASNLGDAEVRGSSAKVTLRDALPAGLVAKAVTGKVAGIPGFIELRSPVQCAVVSGSLVECAFEGSLPPYEAIEAEITVEVLGGAQSGELNEVAVSGGGAHGVSLKRPIVVSNSPVQFGAANFEQAAFNEDGSMDTQAGSHPYALTTTLDFNRTAGEATSYQPALPKDLHFNLPPGLIGNPTPFPQCTDAQFGHGALADRCPADTAVGVATITIYEPLLFRVITVSSPVFNLKPSAGEPARFGFRTLIVNVVLDTSVRTGGDYGVTVSVTNISQIAALLSSQVTFWGVPGDPVHDQSRGWECLDGEVWSLLGEAGPCHAANEVEPPPLLSLPTSCTGPLQPSLQMDSWANKGDFTPPLAAPSQPSMDGCNRLPFEPSIKVAPDEQAGSSPTGLSVGIHVPQDALLSEKGLAESNVKDTTVTLPAGVALNPAAADGLEACSESEIALVVDVFPSCPEASKVGTVEIKTPLLPNALTGAAYLATQDSNPFGSLVALYVVAQDPVSGTLVKVAGEVKPDPVTGQLVSTFDNTPQLPFEDLTLHFFGGSRAPLATPASCGTYTTSASIAPWSGNAPAQPSSNFQITSGPNGGPCHSPLPFTPSLTAGTSSIQAGGFSPFLMTMSREDGEQPLQSIRLKMPPGMSGTLSTVRLCDEADADAGTCNPESQIGETIVSVGVGGTPYTVKGGRVYITGPYKGAPFGLSIVNPAKAGPFDLGQVVVRAKLEVDRETAAITVATDNEGPYKIPTILDGIPLQIKHVSVDINRPGFTFNATNCNPLQITGELTSAEGSFSALSVPYQVTNCAVLAFKPKLEASAGGKWTRTGGTNLNVKLSYPAGPYDANISKVKVELPKGLPSRLPTLQKACLASVFEANPAGCPPASIIGHARATTPVLPVPLEGPAYFVSHGGEAWPSLVIVLQGYGVTVHLVGTTLISKAGITSSTFKTVPDVPVGTFELSLPAGPFSALTGLGNLCAGKSLKMPTEFVGQNGAEIHTTANIALTGCGKAKKVSHKHKKSRRKAKPKRGRTGR
ncbi:MAG TPA: hypothetical protein VNV42_10725 [Solirubrobacteraceae bacterium]|jgi:hypothetical protein|nr:hypothetical protein [Solirubrobacteraceae bacterium]